MSNGKVKWYNQVKCFGFIETETGSEIFVHRSGLVDSNAVLTEGQEVTFDIKQSEKGEIAFNVK